MDKGIESFQLLFTRKGGARLTGHLVKTPSSLKIAPRVLCEDCSRSPYCHLGRAAEAPQKKSDCCSILTAKKIKNDKNWCACQGSKRASELTARDNAQLSPSSILADDRRARKRLNPPCTLFSLTGRVYLCKKLAALVHNTSRSAE